ncbi:RNA pyrophosphohydrolase [Lactococcus protaetiae]|uniref:RNA pyrophosphohydrolase n=1 Tax=Lactococcus protaetiae TaxID=2592653 RepID=A0A514Z7Z1_9LACT|nr:RNA pyrophosphohydrolase [Lactococcus protaetiae]QDK70695.1 RNA pyrophosphohydrolase [Lactococcus protaetiae]
MKEYRKNVAAIIINREHKIWLGERADKMAWGFPQGGIDKGELPEAALYREMMEELATNEFELIAQYPGTLKYDFPADMEFPTWTYAGQEQYYFLIKLRDTAKIDFNSHPEEIEFLTYKFLSLDEIRQIDFDFKDKVYKKALDYFEPFIIKGEN